ncbi:MAG: hypothetical protein ACJAW8_000393 [Oleispira sp.]|jgi:hypothetical protein|tara:strand:- start:9289 stop:9696 length:408 start_codon:yes stop_codon:yes gene_type:complete
MSLSQMAEKPAAEPIYRVIFNNQSEVYELYTRYIFQSEMYGFIEVEELLFDESLISDASDEAEAKISFDKLKLEFTGVKRSFIPLPSVIRIDEMEKPGVVKVSPSKEDMTGNVRHFPSPIFKRPPADPVDTSSDD